MLAESTWQHKVNYKACTKYFPLLLCTTRLAQLPHTRAALHSQLQPLYPKKRNVSRSGPLPKTNPMQHSCGHYNAFCSITWQTRMYLRTWQQNMTTIMQPLHCDLQPQIPKQPLHTHAWTTARCRTPWRNRLRVKTVQAATASHTSCPSSPAAAALPEKTQCFALWLPPQNKPHATFMRPLQCVLQHHVANPHVSTHMATE